MTSSIATDHNSDYKCTTDLQPLLVAVWKYLSRNKRWLLLRLYIMVCIFRQACSSFWIPAWHSQFCKAETLSLLPKGHHSSSLPYLPSSTFLHSSKKAAKCCFSSLTYRHQPQSGFSQWQKINIWMSIKFVLPVAGIIVADKQWS